MNLNDVGKQLGAMLGSKGTSSEEEIIGEVSSEENQEQVEGTEVKGEEEEVSKEGSDEGTEKIEGSKEGEGTDTEIEGEETNEDDETEKEKTPQELQIEALIAQNEKLMEQLNEVSGGEQKEEVEAEPETLDISEEFIGKDDDIEELFSDRDKINVTLNKTASKAVNAALEHVYKVLPDLLTRLVQDEVQLYRQADQFFVENPDLSPHKKFVTYVYKDMIDNDPGTPPAEHLKKLAVEVKKRIGSGEINKGKEKKKEKRRGNFNPASSSRGVAPKEPSGIGAEISAMEKLR